MGDHVAEKSGVVVEVKKTIDIEDMGIIVVSDEVV